MMLQKINDPLSFGSSRNLKSFIILVFLFALTPLSASAVVVKGLFEVKIKVLNESKAVRQSALKEGLAEVLIRVSGNSDILSEIEVPAANSYVQRYEYSTKAGGDQGSSSTRQLWVRYNGTKILSFLRKQSIPIWGERRSQAVMWMAVSDGNRRHIMAIKDTSAIKSNADAAFTRRGVAAIWPKMDALDQKNIRFADILMAFPEPLKQASERYSSGPVIAASMNWDGSVWKGKWTLLMANEVSKWSLSGVDYATLVARATDLTADAMGKKYAVLESVDASQYQQVALEIEPVLNVNSFRRIEKYLMSLSAVQSVQLSQVGSERLFFNLSLRSKAGDFLDQVQAGSMLTLLADKTNKANASSSSKSTTELVALNPKLVAAPLKPITYRFLLR